MKNNVEVIVLAVVLSVFIQVLTFLYLENIPRLGGIIVIVLINITIPFGYLIYETVQFVLAKPRDERRFLFFSIFCTLNLSGILSFFFIQVFN